jgi:hypothetical protein
MALPGVVQVGLAVALLVVGIAIERYARTDRKLRALPWWLQLLVAGVAISPLLFGHDAVPDLVVGDTVVLLAVSLVLWLGLPFLLSRVVATTPPESRATC